MQITQKVKMDLLQYFGATGAPAWHRFTIRDFNLQVMMNVFAPKERAALDVALDELIEAQVLMRVSDTEYVLSPHGFGLVTALRARNASKRRLNGYWKPRRPRPTLSTPPTTARVAVACSD
jgi:hypothetical protein